MAVIVGIVAAIILAGIIYLVWSMGTAGSRKFNRDQRPHATTQTDPKQEPRTPGLD